MYIPHQTTHFFSNPALDAELAYRREVLRAAGRGTRTRRGGWFRNRRTTH